MRYHDSTELDRAVAGSRKAPRISSWRGLTLTVGEVIAHLMTFDRDLPIAVAGSEGGFCFAGPPRVLPLDLEVNSMVGFGPHDLAEHPGECDVEAVVFLASASAGAVP